MSDDIRKALMLSRHAAAFGGGFGFPSWGGAAAFNPMAYGASPWAAPRATGSWLPQFSMPSPAPAPVAPAPSTPSVGGWPSLYNYRPVQQAQGDFGLRRSWSFDPATDPSRLLAKRMEEEAARKAAEDAAMLEKEEASKRFQPIQQSGNDAEGSGQDQGAGGFGGAGGPAAGGGGGSGNAPGAEGGAYGGRMNGKAIRSALRVAHRAAGGPTDNPQDAERKRREREELERKLREYAEAQQGMPRRELMRAAVSAIAAPSLMAGPAAASVRQYAAPRRPEPMDDWQPQDEPRDTGMDMPSGRAEMPERAGTAEGRAPEPGARPDTGDTFKRMLHIESRNSQFDSRGRPLISRAGAVGIGQILPNTAREVAKGMGVEFDLNRLHRDADYNRRLSEAYYAQLVGMFEDPHVAAAAYNAGPGRVKTAMAQAAKQGRSYEEFLPRETQNYLAKLREPHADGGSVGGSTDDDGLDAREASYFANGGEVDPPKRTVKAYKLFRTDKRQPGKLFPLFVNADREVPVGRWLAAEEGPMQGGKVKSRRGPLAYRPGWHAGDLPIATHIGGKSDPTLTKPDYRPDEHVWAEVEMPADVDWQEEAMRRARRTRAGEIDPKTAHITDQIPHGGHYRYRTNPNMTGNWLIGGGLKVNRVLGDDEVKAINDAAGVADLPRRSSAQADSDYDGQRRYAAGGEVDPMGSLQSAPSQNALMDPASAGAPQVAPATQDHPAWIPTRLITSKKAVPGAGPAKPVVDVAAMRETPKLYETNVDLLRDYPNTPTRLRNAPHDRVAKYFVDHVKDNLLALHDAVPDHIRQRSKLWYDGARKITEDWSRKYGVPDHSIAGALAALSPQKDWYQNVSLAQRVLDAMRGNGGNFYHGFQFSPQMETTFNNIRAFQKSKYQDLLGVAKGKTLADLEGLQADADTKAAAKALWIRLHDEAHNDKAHRIITPEGGFGDYVTTAAGQKARIGWGSLVEIGKAVNAIEAANNPELLSGLMGEKHKVRNFYNNILAPRSPHGDVTIDTHAVAAGLWRPLSGNSIEVAHNFGNYAGEGLPNASGSALTGIQGTYPLYAEAYRRAAKERGILPREMQSITWEAVRGLFPDRFKTPANNAKIDAVWNEYRRGRISRPEARSRIHEIAGGIRNPTWFVERDAGPDEVGWAPDDARDVLGRGVYGQSAQAPLGGAGDGSPAAVPAKRVRKAFEVGLEPSTDPLVTKALALTRKARRG